MKIYLAARYSRHPELQGYAEALRVLGHTITSRWIEGNHSAEDTSPSREVRARFAQDDVEDLLAADCCISFTEPPNSPYARGGRHVEFGMAWQARKLLYVIGFRENIFHCLSNVTFYETWDELLQEFRLGRAYVEAHPHQRGGVAGR